MFNEFPYTNYEKINLDWLLDLGNKLKADAESGAFDGERGPGIFGVTNIYSGGAVGGAGYHCNKIGDAGVGDFIIGYGPAAGVNTLYLMKITSVNGNYLEGTTLLQITGPQGPQGQQGEQGEPGEVTQDEFDELSGEVGDLKSAFANIDGFTPEIKSALMAVVEHIGAWSDGNAQTYIQNLRDALYPSEPPAELVSISAVFTQGEHTIYDTDALDTLKQYLVVTAHYDDSSTATVASADYTLTGTLTEGASTITVSYGGFTDTFVVTVTVAPGGEVELLDVYTDLGKSQANVYDGADASSTKLFGNYMNSIFGFASAETFSTDTVVTITASATGLTGRHIFAGSASDFASNTLDAFYGADLGVISSMGNGVSFTVKAGNKLVVICNFERTTAYSLTVSAERG